MTIELIDWNVVSSSKDRIKQTKADWRAGRMKLPDPDHDDFMPATGHAHLGTPTLAIDPLGH